MFFDMSLLLTISDVSPRSGVATSALRFYEELGLIKQVGRDRIELEARTGETKRLRRRENEIDC